MAALPPPPRSDGDTQRALHVLSERRAHLARKEAARRQQPSTDPLDESDEDEDEVYREGHEGEEALEQAAAGGCCSSSLEPPRPRASSPHATAPAEPVARGSLEDSEHWRMLAPGLHVCEEPSACEQAAAGGCCSSSCSGQQANDFERRLPEFRAALRQDGYMQSEDPVVGAATLHALRQAVGALQVTARHALPPHPAASVLFGPDKKPRERGSGKKSHTSKRFSTSVWGTR
jgi:hypothetical protein